MVTKFGACEYLLPEPDYTGGSQNPGVVIAPDRKIKLASPQFELIGTTADDIRRGTHHLFMWGRIKYTDVFTEPHAFGYAVSYDPPTGGFRIVDNPKYNYDN